MGEPRDPSDIRLAHRARFLTVGTLLAGLALSGCSSPDADGSPDGSDPAAGPVGIPDPCALLSPADIEAASGIAFQEGVFNDSISTESQSICDWHPVDGAFPLVQVLVSPGESQVSSQRGSAEDMLGGVVDVAVTGAENAYSVAGGSIVGMTAQGYFVQVSYMTTDLDDATTTTVSLAEAVVASI